MMSIDIAFKKQSPALRQQQNKSPSEIMSTGASADGLQPRRIGFIMNMKDIIVKPQASYRRASSQLNRKDLQPSSFSMMI